MNDRLTNLLKPWTAYFFYGVLFICIGYLSFEYFFISFAALSADEFVFARHIYEYTQSLPYRDFSPYKTVLGYYLFSIPLFFSHSFLTPLFYIKDEIALINALCLALASYWSSQIFNKKALLFVMMLLIANQSFLIYSTDLRVDMLTSWCCLFASLCMLDNRGYLAGMLLGIAFLISQKALWYLCAIDGALLISWLTLVSSPYSFRALFTFNIGFIIPITAYIAVWSLVTSPIELLHNIFYEAYIQASIDWYTPIYFKCWHALLYRGPLLFLLWPLSFLYLFGRKTEQLLLQRRVFIISFSSIALVLLIHYKQPFPYNFVFTLPAFFLLYADFFSQFFTEKTFPLIKNTAFSSRFLWSLMILYCIGIAYFLYAFSLPHIYFLLVPIPILFSIFYFSAVQIIKNKFIFTAIIIILLLTGIVYPLYQSIIQRNFLDGRYQQTMLELTASLLDKDDEYLAGIPFLYQKDQSINGMKNLIGPEIEYLFSPSDKLKSLLLTSLYLAPTTSEEVIENLRKSPLKIVISNYRMLSLPAKIKAYFKYNYQHFYGSLYLYAPTIYAEQLSFYLKFPGYYKVEAKKNARIIIDGHLLHGKKIIYLEKGDHLTDANFRYRLAFIPPFRNLPLNSHYQSDNSVRMIKAIVT